MNVTFYPKAVMVFVAFAIAVWLAADMRVGVAAVLALTIVDALSFGLWPRDPGRRDSM